MNWRSPFLVENHHFVGDTPAIDPPGVKKLASLGKFGKNQPSTRGFGGDNWGHARHCYASCSTTGGFPRMVRIFHTVLDTNWMVRSGSVYLGMFKVEIISWIPMGYEMLWTTCLIGIENTNHLFPHAEDMPQSISVEGIPSSLPLPSQDVECSAPSAEIRCLRRLSNVDAFQVMFNGERSGFFLLDWISASENYVEKRNANKLLILLRNCRNTESHIFDFFPNTSIGKK